MVESRDDKLCQSGECWTKPSLISVNQLSGLTREEQYNQFIHTVNFMVYRPGIPANE